MTGTAEKQAVAGDIWAAGALDLAAATDFLSCCSSMFRAIADQQGWEKKYLGVKVLYPRAAVAAYLKSLPTDPPASLKARVKRIKRAPA